MEKVEKTYFYLLLANLEGQEMPLESALTRAFQRFAELHKHDSEVMILRLSEKREEFEETRVKFDLRKLPAFVVADEPQIGREKANDPYLRFERDVFKVYDTQEKIYRLVSDIHYLVKDEGLLKLKIGRILERTGEFLKRVWEEIKDAVGIGIAVKPQGGSNG